MVDARGREDALRGCRGTEATLAPPGPATRPPRPQRSPFDTRTLAGHGRGLSPDMGGRGRSRSVTFSSAPPPLRISRRPLDEVERPGAASDVADLERARHEGSVAEDAAPGSLARARASRSTAAAPPPRAAAPSLNDEELLRRDDELRELPAPDVAEGDPGPDGQHERSHGRRRTHGSVSANAPSAASATARASGQAGRRRDVEPAGKPARRRPPAWTPSSTEAGRLLSR